MAVDARILELPPMVPPTAVTSTAVNSGNSITSDIEGAISANANLRYYGFTVMEDAGSTASFIIRHGLTVVGGVFLEPVTLINGESTEEWYGPDGIACPNGLTIDHISGSFKLALRTKVVT